MFFGPGIQDYFNRAMFNSKPRHDQNQILQTLYDQGYNVPAIEKFLGIPASTIYARINAHRGRGPGPAFGNVH